MKAKLINTQIEDFLSDYEHNVEIKFLEVGKEKNELIESAKKRGILVENSRDLGVLKTIYAFTDKSNANGAILPEKEFKQILPQIIGKPMDIGHDRRLVVGFYIDYRYHQKENKAITYAVFFKSNFPELWAKAQKLQKKNKLSSSFEIWSPRDKREDIGNGKYKLHAMEIAGGALIFEENGDLPAFKDAKVLTLAKKELEQVISKDCLVFASKYRNKDIITIGGSCQTKHKVEKASVETVEKPIVELKEEIKKEEEKKLAPQIEKVKCSNCSEEFELGSLDSIKCPKCFAILNRSGQMIHPPQIKDFRVLCPGCSIDNWLILSKGNDKGKIRCLSCTKEYEITFATEEKNEILNKVSFVYSGYARCHQCGNSVPIVGTSNVKDRMMKCKKCGLEFSYNITNKKYKNICKIEQIERLEKSSEEEDTKMKDNKAVEKASENEVKKEEKVVEPMVSEKEEIKIENTESIVETKVEEKEEAEEVKVEEKLEDVKSQEAEPESKPEVKAEDKEVEKAEDEKKDEVIDKKVEEQSEAKKPLDIQEAPKVEDEDIDIAKYKENLERYKLGIRKLAKQIKNMKLENASLQKQVDFYKTNAKTIVERQDKLGKELAKDISDDDILNDDKFAKAMVEKENIELRKEIEKGSDNAGDKVKEKDELWYAARRKKIDDAAFGEINKNNKQ